MKTKLNFFNPNPTTDLANVTAHHHPLNFSHNMLPVWRMKMLDLNNKV
jgi:hypothetical protein